MRILFIGNSHTYFNDMPAMFQQECARHGVPADITVLCRGGKGLDDHAEEEQTRLNILYGGYDWVILQHKAHPMGSKSAMFSGARRINAWIRQAGSRALLYQTWTRKGDEAGQGAMSLRYQQLGEALSCLVAPVGDRWQQLRLEHPDWELYDPDGGHASPLGSRLAAQVLCEALLANT